MALMTLHCCHYVLDVLKSQQARIRILEEEVKASQMKELKAYNERDEAVKLVQTYHPVSVAYLSIRDIKQL